MLYRALHEDGGIELQVYYLLRGSSLRPWKSELGVGYPSQYMRRVLNVDWGLLRKAWSDPTSLFLVANWGHLALLAVILTRYLRRAPIGMWVDTPTIEDIHKPLLQRWARRLLLRRLLPRLDIIFATGKPARRVLEAMGARSEQIVNLPFYVDLDSPIRTHRDPEMQARAQQWRALVRCAGEGMVFCMIGSLVKRKGHDIGLQAFAQCKQQTKIPIGLLIVGEGPERKTLEHLAADLHLGDSVAFLGWREPHEMQAVYLASDIVLHPSRHDPFPVVVLEAMSWSKVVVGSNVCGSVEDRVQHGVNGYSFPSEDVEALVQIMLDLVNHPDKLLEVGTNARRTAEEWPLSRCVETVVHEIQRRLGVLSDTPRPVDG